MTRILTGIQSTGIPHLGNVLGAIRPAVTLGASGTNETSCSSPICTRSPPFTTLQHCVRTHTPLPQHGLLVVWTRTAQCSTARAMCRKSTELTWYLGCFTPYPMLANAHSFKDKSDRLSAVNAGLFYYPVLMAADILLYDANVVPVGKDQKQHLEITRDIASAFNKAYGETLVLPEAQLQELVMVVPGTDGQKMSKSYGNTIILFAAGEGIEEAGDGHRYRQHAIGGAEEPGYRQCVQPFRLLAPAAAGRRCGRTICVVATATATPRRNCCKCCSMVSPKSAIPTSAL